MLVPYDPYGRELAGHVLNDPKRSQKCRCVFLRIKVNLVNLKQTLWHYGTEFLRLKVACLLNLSPNLSILSSICCILDRAWPISKLPNKSEHVRSVGSDWFTTLGGAFNLSTRWGATMGMHSANHWYNQQTWRGYPRTVAAGGNHLQPGHFGHFMPWKSRCETINQH